jgi:hypothetical protein
MVILKKSNFILWHFANHLHKYPVVARLVHFGPCPSREEPTHPQQHAADPAQVVALPATATAVDPNPESLQVGPQSYHQTARPAGHSSDRAGPAGERAEPAGDRARLQDGRIGPQDGRTSNSTAREEWRGGGGGPLSQIILSGRGETLAACVLAAVVLPVLLVLDRRF